MIICGRCLLSSFRAAGLVAAGIGLCAGLMPQSVLSQVTASTPINADSVAPGRLIDLGGYRLHLYCTGSRRTGGATVVLSAGSGDLAVDWGLIQPSVARGTRVCSYDRAGDGWSDVGPQPETLHQEVADLHAALERAGEKPPYVLVGHSLGGLVVRIYQHEYPAEVTGVVLVDPTHEDVRLSLNNQLVRMRSLAKDRPIPPAHTFAAAAPKPATAEWLKQCAALAASARIEAPYDALPPSDQRYRLWEMQHPKCAAPGDNYLAEELASIYASRQRDPQPLGSLPLIVVTGARGDVPPGLDTTAWRKEKADHMADLATLSSAGRLISDSRSGHHVQLDDPTVVINAIREVLRPKG